MKLTIALIVAALALGACDTGNDEPAGEPAGEAAARAATAEREAERYRDLAMRETAELARRICGEISPRVLARALGGTDFARSDTSPNAIALGLVRDVAISPIPLQRAAHNGCMRGVRSQR